MIQKRGKEKDSLPISCCNTGNCAATTNNFSSVTLGVNYTVPHSNGINEPADEKDVGGETDERGGWISCSYTDRPQISAMCDFTEYQISFERWRPANGDPAAAAALV